MMIMMMQPSWQAFEGKGKRGFVAKKIGYGNENYDNDDNDKL